MFKQLEDISSLPGQLIEYHLDRGEVFALMSNGNYWRVRRNGKTKTWKREPERFRIPIKFGMYGYGQITETDKWDYRKGSDFFVDART